MNKFDKALEFVVLGGFLALVFALLQWIVPEANQQLFSQALGVLSVIVTLVAKSLWERNSSEAKLSEQRVENVAKSYDAIKTAAESLPATTSLDASAAADEVAQAADDKAEEISGKVSG